MKRFFCGVAALFCLGVVLPGCTSGPEAVAPGFDENSFFPAPPDLPRVQFLRSYNGSQDFRRSRPLLDYLAGTENTAEYLVEKPFSVASYKGRIYVTDSFGLQGVNVFDLANQRFYLLGKDQGPGELKKPIHVFVDAQGNKLVSDVGRRQIVQFAPDESFVRVYGDGSSFLPVSCVTHGGELFLLDIMKDKMKPAEPDLEPEEVRRDQILVLDLATGKPLRRIGKHGSGQEGFSFASFLAVDRLGAIYISDFLNHRVVKLDREGNVLAEFGRHGDRAGDFSQMKGIAVDPDGLIYVVDAAFQAVQAFDNAGKPLFALGGPRARRGPMDLPAGIWIDDQNVDLFRDLYAPGFKPKYLIIVANQLSTANKIAVYAYGEREGAQYPATADLSTLAAPSSKVLWQLPTYPPEQTTGKVLESQPHPGAEVDPEAGSTPASVPR